MALIGTISGSVGAGGSLISATAISGTLIIADAPPGSFPAIQSGVKLFVSGSKTTLGADTPNAIFGGDTFVSGAFGTESYIQMKPVGSLSIPTNTTASYIYASGSTSDIYFTQYSGSLRNDLRLRWLEGTLTTGLLNGGVLSTANGTTTFSATAGSGIIVSQNASISVDPYPTIKYVSWPAFVSSSLLYSGSAQISYIAVDSAGALQQLNTPPTLAQYKDRIFLGRILHQTGSVSNGAINSPAMAYAVSSNTFDFIRPFGPLKVSGHFLAASGSTMGLTKTAGDSYSEGRNYAFDPSAPNTILAADDPDLLNSKIYYQYVSGSTTITNTGVGNAGFTFVTASLYNNNGTLAAVGNSEWTNQRVFWFPKSVNRALFVYFGTKKYGTLLEAVAGLLTEGFVEGDNTKGAAIYVGSISVKGNETNLTDTTNVTITQGGLFRGAGGGGGGGGGITPPGGLTTQVQFNDGSAFGGDAGLTYDKATDSLTVAGNITGSNLRLTGDLTVIGGDLTTNAGTLRIWGSSSPVVGSDAFFYVSGSTTPGTSNIVLGGYTIVSGGLEVKDSTGKTVSFLGSNGAISGSNNLSMGGSITGSNLLLTSGFIVTGSGIIESNTSTAALRVTQQGSGNAITVEDSANPDSSPFVVAADGKVGIGTTTPTANLFVSGTDTLIPAFVAKGPDVTVNTLTVTGSAGASTAVGFVNIDQGNYSNKYGLMISNIGAGTAGLKLSANTTGGSFAIDNMNSTPQITMTHKNLWFNSVSTAFDTSQITYKFIENNKGATYPNQKTFLISGNTNGPKTGSYFEVEKSGSAGPIKILELQGDTTDNALFVSGAFLTSGSITVAGDIAVNGGDITSTAATLNISAGASGLAFQRSGASFATFVSGASGPMQLALLQAASGKSLTLAAGAGSGQQVTLSGSFIDLRSAMGAPAGVDFSTEVGGLASSYLNVSSGSYTTVGSTSTNITKIAPGDVPLPHDLLVGASAARTLYLSGSSVVANMGNNGFFFQRDGSSYGVVQGVSGSSFTIGSAAGVISMNLVSSGNVTVKLDSDNNATGHKFIVQDWNNIDQFSVGENGNAEISGSLVISGSTSLGSTVERLTTSTGGTGTVTFDTTFNSIFYVNGPAGDILANFTNVPTANNNRVVTTTVILSQSATPRIISGIQVNSTSGSILWANKTIPTGTANQQDVFGFSLIRSGSIWTVLGQMSTYG